MAEATLVPRDNASNRIFGPARIVDAEGNLIRAIPDGEYASLCRCGHSKEKPFCDSTHKEIGFQSVVRASDAHLQTPNDPD
jgi:CDGSH-type Zn-finger protein